MKSFMPTRPNSSFGRVTSSPASSIARRTTFVLKALSAALPSAGLLITAPTLAADTPVSSKAQTQSDASKAVHSQLDKQAADAASEKRKKVLIDATAAIARDSTSA